MKLEPWSDWIDFGNPTWEKKLIRHFTTFFALIFLRGIASGNLVEEHIIVSKYSLPDLVLGNGPTQSTITWLQGSWKAGVGYKGGLGIIWLGLPTIWQVWHVLQYFTTSLLSLGQ